jgi:hypothetical protein
MYTLTDTHAQRHTDEQTHTPYETPYTKYVIILINRSLKKILSSIQIVSPLHKIVLPCTSIIDLYFHIREFEEPRYLKLILPSSAQAQAQLEAELALFSFDPASHPPPPTNESLFGS